jgi:hypothetical protein
MKPKQISYSNQTNSFEILNPSNDKEDEKPLLVTHNLEEIANPPNPHCPTNTPNHCPTNPPKKGQTFLTIINH